MLIVFLSSGLFLGWSLGSNDAANVFGTAVGSKMVRFKTAAIVAAVFIVIGAVFAGSGAAHTLCKLGAVNAIGGSFMVALAAGITVFWMTRLKLPVSTSQAIVGAIIGWNFFSRSLTDYDALIKILLTWVLCPVLAAVTAAAIFSLFRIYMRHVKLNLFRVDSHTRIGLILVGAFGAYSLGANNIANVMGVFVPVAPFSGFEFLGFHFSSAQILFFIGSLTIGAGVITYSKKVMDTVGSSLMKISPVAAFVVVLAEAIVLFLFSSEALENWLVVHGLPAIPLVPVSSSQAVVGAVIGIGLVKGGKGIHFGVLGEIALGWVTTPVIAGIISFVSLFFLQNVFNQNVYEQMHYKIGDAVIRYIEQKGIPTQELAPFKNKNYYSAQEIQTILQEKTRLKNKEIVAIIRAANVQHFFVEKRIVESRIDKKWVGAERYRALKTLVGRSYAYKFQLLKDLASVSNSWKFKKKTPVNNLYNKQLRIKFEYVAHLLKKSNKKKI